MINVPPVLSYTEPFQLPSVIAELKSINPPLNVTSVSKLVTPETSNVPVFTRLPPILTFVLNETSSNATILLAAKSLLASLVAMYCSTPPSILGRRTANLSNPVAILI